MMRAAVSLAGAALVFAIVACTGSDPDLVGASSGTTSSGASSGTSSSGASSGTNSSGASGGTSGIVVATGCPVGCLPPAPDGWTGPSAFFEGAPADAPTSCPGFYDVREVDAFVLTASPPLHACGCGPSSVLEVSCTATMQIYSQLGCTAGQGPAIPVTDTRPPGNSAKQCNMVAIPKLHAHVIAQPITGKCTSPTAAVIPDPPKDKVEIACGRSQPSACDGHPECTATPRPGGDSFSRLCIHKAGVETCPNIAYPNRILASSGVDDTRACSACSAHVTGTCGSSFTLYGAGCTSSNNQAFAPSPNCQNIGDTYGSADTTGLRSTDATCPVTQGVPSGAATPKDPVTFCCANQ